MLRINILPKLEPNRIQNYAKETAFPKTLFLAGIGGVGGGGGGGGGYGGRK